MYLINRYNYDKEEVNLRALFSSAGLDYNGAIEKLKSFNLYNQVLEAKTMASNHWLLFSAISLFDKKPSTILEIGTFDAETTKLLTKLFPAAEVTTVDLKDNDPIFKDFYNRDTESKRSEFIRKRNEILQSSEKITFIQDSSFFLLERIPSNQKFDLIWVDGAHNFPEVAWDICSSYHLLSDNGIMMCDDIIFKEAGHRDEYASPDAKIVLDHLTQRRKDLISPFYFLKRNSAEWSSDPRKRKYVALLKKV